MRRSTCMLMIILLLLTIVFPGAASAAVSQEYPLYTYDFFGLKFDVRFVEGAAILYLPGGLLELPQAVSASGARYTDGQTTFWIKGDNACMEINGSVVK